MRRDGVAWIGPGPLHALAILLASAPNPGVAILAGQAKQAAR